MKGESETWGDRREEWQFVAGEGRVGTMGTPWWAHLRCEGKVPGDDWEGGAGTWHRGWGWRERHWHSLRATPAPSPQSFLQTKGSKSARRQCGLENSKQLNPMFPSFQLHTGYQEAQGERVLYKSVKENSEAKLSIEDKVQTGWKKAYTCARCFYPLQHPFPITNMAVWHGPNLSEEMGKVGQGVSELRWEGSGWRRACRLRSCMQSDEQLLLFIVTERLWSLHVPWQPLSASIIRAFIMMSLA